MHAIPHPARCSPLLPSRAHMQLPRRIGQRAPVDVMGVVLALGSYGTVKRKADNSELPRREVTIGDQRYEAGVAVVAACVRGSYVGLLGDGLVVRADATAARGAMGHVGITRRLSFAASRTSARAPKRRPPCLSSVRVAVRGAAARAWPSRCGATCPAPPRSSWRAWRAAPCCRCGCGVRRGRGSHVAEGISKDVL